MKKTKILAVITSAAILASMGTAFADTQAELVLQINNPMMTVNGVQKEIDPGVGTSPVLLNDRTLLPVRAVIEEIGGTVDWNDAVQEVTLTYGQDEIRLTIDSTTAYLNNEAQTLDTAPTLINDRTMLPIRFIAESFDFDVDWDDATQTVTITKEAEVAVEPTAEPTQAPTSEPTAASQPSQTAAADVTIYLDGGNLDLVLESNATTAALLSELYTQPMHMPPAYDMDSTYKYYDIPSRYLSALGIVTDTVTSAKAGDVYITDEGRLIIYYKDASSISEKYSKVGTVIDTTDIEALLGSGEVEFSVGLYVEK